MKIKETFTTGNGWRHSLLFLGLTNILMYWSVSNYAHSTKTFPSSMMASLSELPDFWQWFIYTFVAVIGGILIEMIEGDFWKAKFSKPDIYWGVFGAQIAFVISLLFPYNGWILLFSIFAVPFTIWHFSKQFYVKK